MRNLSRERLTPEDFEAFSAEAIVGSDRACALVCCSFVENILKDLLETYMREDWLDLRETIFDGPLAPLSSFSSRIAFAYAVEAIDDTTLAALNAIRNIRNVFAHSEKPRTFEHEAIAAEVAFLEMLPQINSEATPRRKYVAACLTLGAALGQEMGKRRKNQALVNALKQYVPPSSPEK